MSFRIDKDSLGEFKVPKNAYYGSIYSSCIRTVQSNRT